MNDRSKWMTECVCVCDKDEEVEKNTKEQHRSAADDIQWAVYT